MHILKPIAVTLLLWLSICGASGGGNGGGKGGGINRSEKSNLLEDTLNDVYEELANNAKKKKCERSMGSIREWLRRVDEDHTNILIEVTKASFYQNSNYTKYNTEQLQEKEARYNDMMMTYSSKAYDFLQRERDLIKECNQTVYRMLSFYSRCTSLIPLQQQDRLRLLQVQASLGSKEADLEILKDGQTYKLEPHLNNLMRESRDYEELLWAWNGWHDKSGVVLKKDYDEMVEILNKTVRERGYKDVAEVWQLEDYDEEVEGEMDELMMQLMPFYTQLHAYVREKLFNFYSAKSEDEKLKSFFADKSNPIPAHLLGNMWAQEWDNIEDIVLPYPDPISNPDPNPNSNPVSTDPLKKQTSPSMMMKEKGWTIHDMFLKAEEFFVSLGLPPMTHLFWKNSIVERVANVTMQCHASAHDLIAKNDYRILMCTEVNFDYLRTIHHEMGHVVYFMAYSHLPVIFRNGANSAFHEAIGDTIALSVNTQKHLKMLGLIIDDDGDDGDDGDVYKKDINSLMKEALNRVAFLPWAYLVDKWRFRLFRGEIEKDEYNVEWWKLRLKFQGIIPPSDRTHHHFDAGAKYHVPSNVPYSRYFFSFLAQFQFHQELCREASQEDPLHKCDIFQSEQAGRKLQEMLTEGARTPWRKVLKKMTGTTSFNTTALLTYFRPLHEWLQRQDVVRGWESV